MGIHYLEFKNMYNHFEKELPIKLSDAVDRWLVIKDIGKDTMLGWKELLDEVTTDLIEHGYSINRAKRDTWKQYYEAIVEDSRRWYFHISDLEEEFFNHQMYPCRECGWFTWDPRKGSGYCNNFSIERISPEGRCISEDE